MAVPFATSDDLADGWRPLTPEETTRANVLLARASRLIRSSATTLDARILAGTFDGALAADIACDMVRRSMMGGIPGAQQATNSVGAVSVSVTYTNPAGNLYLTAEELRRLSGSVGRGKAFAVDVLPAFAIDVVPDYSGVLPNYVYDTSLDY